jgi:hypothetical protein
MYTQYSCIASLKGEVKALVILIGSSMTAKVSRLKKQIITNGIIRKDFLITSITNNQRNKR